MSNNEEIKPSPETLLTEYQASQASAEHHDGIAWNVTSVIWGASLILIGFVLDNLQDMKSVTLLTLVSILGFLLLVVLSIVQYVFWSIKNQKYDRCKSIEKQLGMDQHTNLEYKRFLNTTLYIIVNFFFALIWIYILHRLHCD